MKKHLVKVPPRNYQTNLLYYLFSIIKIFFAPSVPYLRAYDE
jgi:hypothetical protein